MSPRNAERKIAIIGAIIRVAKKVANVDELFQLYKNTYIINYQPTLSIIFCDKGPNSAIFMIGKLSSLNSPHF